MTSIENAARALADNREYSLIDLGELCSTAPTARERGIAALAAQLRRADIRANNRPTPSTRWI